jgi:hypothetical protein
MKRILLSAFTASTLILLAVATIRGGLYIAGLDKTATDTCNRAIAQLVPEPMAVASPVAPVTPPKKP